LIDPSQQVYYYWEHLEEQIGNMKKPPPKKIPAPSPNPKEKKLGPFECMWSLLIGCMKIMVLKLQVTIFQPRQMKMKLNHS
jgi:hypothetical protein